MVNTIDMQDMMYLNLFNQITRVRTRFCFKYNETIYFCVPKHFVAKAVGEGGKNVRRMSEMTRRKIKIIAAPEGISDARNFIQSIVTPVTFKGLEVKEGEIIVNANTQSKAALIGRNKRRLMEMQGVVRDFFGKEFKIV